MPMFEEMAFLIDEGGGSQLLPPAGLTELGFKEREHVQEWVVAHPQVLGDGVCIITTEYDRWQSPTGEPIKDRLDILALAPDGRLVVAELKRGPAPHAIHMQAINYAAMVSRLSAFDVAELYVAAQQRRGGLTADPSDVLSRLQTEFLLTDDSTRNPRIVLIAEEFPSSVSACAVWLWEQKLDISLIRYRPYRLASGQVVVTFSRFFPVPNLEDFTVGRLQTVAGPAVASEVSIPWDGDALRRLAVVANAATLALLDLCSNSAAPIGVKDIQTHADLTVGQVRGQLAGFTMLLRNKKNGFEQTRWPVEIEWLEGGVAAYTLPQDLKSIWRSVRGVAAVPAARLGAVVPTSQDLSADLTNGARPVQSEP